MKERPDYKSLDELEGVLMTVDQILEREAQTMGRKCELVDFASLEDDVITVVYEVEAFEFGNYRQQQTRVATYVGDKQVCSGIVKTDG